MVGQAEGAGRNGQGDATPGDATPGAGAMKEPCRPFYDASVGVDAVGEAIVRDFFALVKVHMQWDEVRRSWTALPAIPLFHDMRDPKLTPRFDSASDWWPDKRFVDVVVQGFACAPPGRPVAEMDVRVDVGARTRRVRVIGERTLSWEGNRPVFGHPEAFERMPMRYEHAYGGIDFRVAWDDGRLHIAGYERVDHPGLYPRNPFGKGYLVDEDPLPTSSWLPNLEDPDDLLTPERLCTGDPMRWYDMPLPACLDWTPLMTYPRLLFWGAEPYFPVPRGVSHAESRLGCLPDDAFLSALREDQDEEMIVANLHAFCAQGAPRGLMFETLAPRTPIRVQGMHEERAEVCMQVPEPPQVEALCDGKREALQPRLQHLVLCPNDLSLTAVYRVAWRAPRAFIPGVHAKIPVGIRVNGDAPVMFDTPETVRVAMGAQGAAPLLPAKDAASVSSAGVAHAGGAGSFDKEKPR